MKLREVLAFALKNRATEVLIAVDQPPELHVGGEIRRVNLPPITGKDFEALVKSCLGAPARESLRVSGRCEETIEMQGLGQVRAIVEARKARFVLPGEVLMRAKPASAIATDRSPGAVPTFSERLRDLFGGKR